jgi:crossover junction endodeoxyribonuclease RuvC
MALDGITLDEFLALTATRGKRRQPRPPQTFKFDSQLKHLRVIGIDPGTIRVGWGVIEVQPENRALKLVDCGCIEPGSKLELRFRLRTIFAELETILQRTKPHAGALEETFAGVNMKSAIAMGQGRGIALLCLTRANLDVLELSPRSIKQAVTGSGASGKAHVASLVAAHLHLKKPPQPEDVTDALAAAIALAQRMEHVVKRL